MAEEYHKKREEELTNMYEQGDKPEGYQLGSPELELRIKQEGILQRLKIPAVHLLTWTVKAIRAMVEENS